MGLVRIPYEYSDQTWLFNLQQVVRVKHNHTSREVSVVMSHGGEYKFAIKDWNAHVPPEFRVPHE